MANEYTLKGLFKDIADSIREKTGETDLIPANEFSEKILSISNDLFIDIVTGEITTIEASDLDGITSIGSHAFAGCSKLESVTLPEGVTSIGYSVFNECSSLTTLTLPSSITKIEFNSFENCPNLVTINVPWSEGYISKAPWGATNATINYNYGG